MDIKKLNVNCDNFYLNAYLNWQLWSTDTEQNTDKILRK